MARRLNLRRRLGENDFSSFVQLTHATPAEIREIEQTGKIPTAVANRMTPDTLRWVNQNYISKLPTAKAQIGEKVDEAKFGLEDVEQRLEAYRQVGEIPPTPTAPQTSFPNVNPNIVAVRVKTHAGLTDEQSQNVANLFMQQLGIGALKSKTDVANWIKNASGTSTAGDSVAKLFEDKDFVPLKAGAQPDYTTDISRLQTQAGALREKGVRTEALSTFLRETPGELTASRREFIAGERGQEISRLREKTIPDIAQSLNVRGGLYSGELGAQVSEAAISSQQQLEDLEYQLQVADENFFADAAYQTKLQKSIEAGQDVSGEIAAGRTEQRLRQSQQFSSAQSEIQRQYETGVARRRAERQYQTREQERASALRRQKSQSEAGLYAGLAKTAATIGTAIVAPQVAPIVGLGLSEI